MQFQRSSSDYESGVRSSNLFGRASVSNNLTGRASGLTHEYFRGPDADPPEAGWRQGRHHQTASRRNPHAVRLPLPRCAGRSASSSAARRRCSRRRRRASLWTLGAAQCKFKRNARCGGASVKSTRHPLRRYGACGGCGSALSGGDRGSNSRPVGCTEICLSQLKSVTRRSCKHRTDARAKASCVYSQPPVSTANALSTCLALMSLKLSKLPFSV